MGALRRRLTRAGLPDFSLHTLQTFAISVLYRIERRAGRDAQDGAPVHGWALHGAGGRRGEGGSGADFVRIAAVAATHVARRAAGVRWPGRRSENHGCGACAMEERAAEPFAQRVFQAVQRRWSSCCAR